MPSRRLRNSLTSLKMLFSSCTGPIINLPRPKAPPLPPLKISSHLEKKSKARPWSTSPCTVTLSNFPSLLYHSLSLILTPATLAFLVLQMLRGWCCATNFYICCWETPKNSLKWLDHFTVPLLAVHGCPNFSMSSPTLVIIMSLNLTSQCVWRGISLSF